MTYVFGTFVLDVSARQLSRGEDRVNLTPRAFELLAALVAARPRALGKDELLQGLWPETYVGDSSLAQLVTEVRRALGDDRRRPCYIRTVFRFGYAFCGEAREREAASRGEPVCALLWGGREIGLVEGEENLIGRDPAARIRLGGSLVSRRHARIVVSGRNAVLHDLDSKNGTFVGRQRVRESRPLTDGDKVIIGGHLLVFVRRSGVSSTRTASRAPQRR
jgi:DNA-binding winged helix-turn-helix (wHTH) protein